MEVLLPGRVIMRRVTALVGLFVGKEHDAFTSPLVDSVHEEICRIEQALADVATRPSRVVRKPELSEPLTEQQKIIDLAG
ncbi:MAG: hypothetical protein KDJ65_07255 [Anaerolineae bacterium]|nr:hypothetical protein [Anaerolineae bacterium]